MTDSLRDTLQRALGGAWRIERELGGGGMSRVFVARDLALDRDVVVKVLSPESTAGVSGDRFRREIQLIARLQHPHIVSILSAGAADGALFYVMPFIGGETLRARLTREGPFSVADVVRVLREVLDALAFAHRHGVIHRDIKPENVLIEAGHAVVADFGIAKALVASGTMTSVGVALGTPAYMAPEQATADPATDHRADLYAVGVLAYELLVGVPPFSGTPQQVITAHLTTPAPVLRDRRSDVPAALNDLVARALAKDPAERPQSAAEMLATIDAVVTPASATLPATSAPPPRHTMRWRVATVVGGIAMVAATATALIRGRGEAPVVAEGTEVIAVMPLGAVSDTSLARLGQDLVVTLSTNLDGVGALRTVDAITLLVRARTLPSPLPLADAQRLARELGARSVLTGTLISEGERVRASVVLRRVDNDSALATAVAVATPRDIAALTDSLTWGVLRQVWRRGTSPSPVLSGLTTNSFDALRAFLDGERHFQRLDVAAALTAYRRAFELDSMFVQAFLRHDFVTSWQGSASDPYVRARLAALADRLPERERLWLQTRKASLPIPAHFAAWQSLVRRYPDYPPMLYAPADLIIHYGPLYGIPIVESLPFLERLARLSPGHVDTKLHAAMVATIAGSPTEAAVAADSMGPDIGAPWGAVMAWEAEIARAKSEGRPPSAEKSLEVAQSLVRAAAADQNQFWLSGFMGVGRGYLKTRLEAVARARAAGIYTGDIAQASAFGEGSTQASRGDFTGALATLRRAEGASRLPMDARMTSARFAVIGAWLDAVDPALAEDALLRVRRIAGVDSTVTNRIELQWLDGLLGVVKGDEARLRRAENALRTGTVPSAHHAARSLAGLWIARSNLDVAADTLKALSDEAMKQGGFLLSAEGVDRLVVARALRRRGVAANVERYLMWTDAALNTSRAVSVVSLLYPLNTYERGVALDEAGDSTAAAFQLRRFVDEYDQPPAAHRAFVDDANRRLLRLAKGDTPPPPKAVK